MCVWGGRGLRGGSGGSGGPQGGDTGGVKKTSTMKGKVFFTGDRHTGKRTHGHCDSMTESAQWADSVKIMI